jgi:catechol 2,3-dioxygenase-like lactoylglutathione lyase family enzyme
MGVMTQVPDEASAVDVAARVRSAVLSRNLDAFAVLLDDNVRWGSDEETPQTCHSRADVLKRLDAFLGSDGTVDVIEVLPSNEAILLGLDVRRQLDGGARRKQPAYHVLTIRNGLVTDIRVLPDRAEAFARAGLASADAEPQMVARQVIPILNVSSLPASFEWFAKLGWARHWDWGDDAGPTFGAVVSGECEIFLCLEGQGGRGRDGGVDGGGEGVWLSVWVDSVDALHDRCAGEGLDVVRPPQDEPWGVREMHVRHPDGHVLRITQPIHGH